MAPPGYNELTIFLSKQPHEPQTMLSNETDTIAGSSLDLLG